jgi:hypothetical protein
MRNQRRYCHSCDPKKKEKPKNKKKRETEDREREEWSGRKPTLDAREVLRYGNDWRKAHFFSTFTTLGD